METSFKVIPEPDPSLQGVDTGNEFNFKCRFCARNMSSRQNLKEHIYTHTGERPYKCPWPGCSKTYRQGSLYSIHRKTHLKTGKFRKVIPEPTIATPSYPKLTALCPFFPDSLLDNQEKLEILKSVNLSTFNFAHSYLMPNLN